VDAHVPVASADVPFERGLLVSIQDVAGREEEDSSLIRREACIVEDGGILVGVDRETVLGTERRHGRDGVRNRLVPVLGGLGEDEYSIRSLLYTTWASDRHLIDQRALRTCTV